MIVVVVGINDNVDESFEAIPNSSTRNCPKLIKADLSGNSKLYICAELFAPSRIYPA